ncbi:MAG: hypothetical protein IPK33_11845 [Gemmatimonadetes bacterium]|nr:hypothetical protein [Gemmatimonadota bacterium]
MDLHNSDGFATERDALDDLVDAVLKVSSQQGGRQIAARLTVGINLYTRMTVAAVSLLRLLPGNRLVEERWTPWWDWPTTAAVARNVIEAYLMFHYVAIEPISVDEDDLRRQVFWYHDNWEKRRLYQDWGASPEVLAEFDEKLPRDRTVIEKNAAFALLTKDQQKRALSGHHAIYLTRTELRARLPFSSSEMPGLYRLLSANVHAAPFSFHRQDNSRGRGMENEADRGYMCLASHFSRKYIAASVIELCNAVPDLRADAPEAFAKAQRHFLEVEETAYPDGV